jgi:hypothetical protein
MFAAWQHGRGWSAGSLYEVEPVGPVEVDPNGEGDWVMAQVLACTTGYGVAGPPGGSWTAPAARVVSVLAQGARMSLHAQAAADDAARIVSRVRHLNLTDQPAYRLVLERTDTLQDHGMNLREALVTALDEQRKHTAARLWRPA